MAGFETNFEPTNIVTEEEYRLARAGSLPPEDLEQGGLFTERLILPADDPRGFAKDGLEKVIRTLDRGEYSRVVIQPVSDDGETRLEDITADIVTPDGIIIDPATGAERGYFLHAEGAADELLRRAEDELLVPVRLRQAPEPLRALEMELPDIAA